MSTMCTAATLTARQHEVLEWIRSHIEGHSYSPTVREAADAFGCTPNGIVCHLRALRAKGRITWSAGQTRSIRITGGAA